jgi:gliding motility-associated-like protein
VLERYSRNCPSVDKKPKKVNTMKRPTTFKLLLVVLFCIQSCFVYSQKNFTVRYDTSLKGDMLLIGNSILNRNENRNNQRQNDPYNDTNKNNNDFDMQYVDIDTDPTTFSSSSARLTIPTASRECYKIVYAGLYWAGIYSQASVNDRSVDRTKLNTVKFKLPNETAYREITGSLIYDYYPSTANGSQMPYAYYYDATSLIQGLANPEGNYTVANIISARGRINGGYAAGWNLFVVYEDPKSSAKYITSYDGFRFIEAASGPLTYNVSGFRTIPTGAVNAKLAFAALEGDVNITGDQYKVNGTVISTTERPNNNFFNSTINDISGPFTQRSLNSGNTLGFDASIIRLNNAGNTIIKNNDTSANLTLSTNGDGYALFFNAFNVEIIEPKIVLTKIVKNSAGVDIGGQDVNLGDQLTYEVGFQNKGNDNATSLTIRDQLPINVIFNYPSDIIQLPTGVSVQSYDPVTRNIVFSVNNNILEVGDPVQTIIFRVRVVPDCSMLDEACSNSIDNSAYATYRGQANTTFQISDDPSVNINTGCILVPKATNFLVGIDGCRFTENVTLCTDNVDLVAANGYSSYTWYSDEARTIQIGTGQTLNVKNPGTYYVYNVAPTPCRSIYQAFTVTRFGNTATNPVIPFADQVVTCPNDGKQLPNIFLCGVNARREITTNISDASSLVWEKLNEASCTAVTNENCANENESCQWNTVGTGSTYSAGIAGQYRLTINYAGGCFNRYYFNVYTNSLNATETHQDILCGVNGNITVNGVPAGYEYAISVDPSGPIGAYQTSNVFPITTANSYTVHIRQTGATTNPCIFTIPNILIRNRSLALDTYVTQPVCNGEKGSIKVGALNIDPQYYYYLYEGSSTTPSISVGPLTDSDYTFANLNPGVTYRVRVTNKPIVFTAPQTGPTCDVSANITIQHPPTGLTATADLVTPLTPCSSGKIQINASGGNGAPYFYFINGSTTFETSNEIEFTTPGNYTIRVLDSQNCETTTSITVTDNPKPVYNVTATTIDCYGGTAQINVNVSNANGYAIEYSRDNGATFGSSSTFSNLPAGTYQIVVRYTLNGTTCTDPAQAVTIAAPASALTASGGVAELSGCGPAGNTNQGKLRITNAQGGTLPYEYSFDGGNTWITSNEAYVNPGTYTLYIRDAKQCTYAISGIVLDPKPADPTIRVEDPVFNCDGSANTTVTVTNSGSANYSYEYYIDNVPNTPITNNVFTNVGAGNHTISVKYNLVSVPTYSVLLQEDFGRGAPTTSPGINSAYCFEDQSGVHPPGYTCNLDNYINDGEYAVTNRINPRFSSWLDMRDHTSNGTDSQGRFLAINIGGVAGVGGIIYRKPIFDVIPNQDVQVSFWVANLINSASAAGNVDPNITIELIANFGLPNQTLVASQATGIVPKSNKWENYNMSLNPGSYSTLDFVVRSYSVATGGNDLTLDDISVYQLPKSCITQVDFDIIVPDNKAFSAAITGHKDVSCNGANDGEITLSAQNFNLPYGFDYSIDNGTTWINSKVSPVTVTGLSSQTYAIQIRFDNNASTCNFPFSQPIGTPQALGITASVTTQPTCSNGAVITAIATGGTPGYQYELRAADGTTVVTAFQNSGIFTNIPSGNYRIVARDLNLCQSSASALVNVSVPTPPTASLATSSNLCYTTGSGATLVVTATGTGTLTYSLNGSAAQNSATFTNVGVGTHTIVVRDSNNCTVTISGIVVAPQLGATAAVTKTLDCTTTPDATITVTPSQGTSPYTYEVSTNNGVSYTAIASNVYSTAIAGTFVFRITDAVGCTVTTSATINPITNPTVSAASQVNVTCSGSSDGSVTLVGSGGSGGYTYSANATAGFTTNPTFTGLAAGTYTYYVRDSKGCVGSTSITITQPVTLDATTTVVPFSCNAANGKVAATVTINATAGTAPYQYSFNGSAYTSTNVLTLNDNGSDQNYTYSVRDAAGCIVSGSGTLERLNSPTDLSFANAAVTCNAPTATVTLTAVNGVGALQYETIAPSVAIHPKQTSNVFAGLSPGSYTFRVTDANGCYYTEVYTIAPVTPIAITGNLVNDVLCKGGSTGNGTFTISGIATVGNYTFTLTAGTLGAGTLTKSGNTLTLSNVAVGTYTVQVTDLATGCTNSAWVTIGEPVNPLTFTASASNVNCNNDNSQITVTAAGGTPNYTYAAVVAGSLAPLASAYQSSNIVTVDTNSGANLTWDVYVKDANGCITINPVTIISDPIPSVTAVVSNQCTATGSNFTITATGTGGVGTLTYGINGSTGTFVTGNVFNVAPGTYTVWVKDQNGCTASAAPLTVYPQLTAIGAVKELDCSLTPDATITVTPSGGRSPYVYAVSTNGTPFTAMASNVYTTSTAGNFQIRVTDANNCTFIVTQQILPITNPTLSIASQVNVTCSGLSNGSVTLAGNGGSGGYTYSASATGTFTINPTFTGLAAGTYTYYVRDSKGCVGSTSVTITQPVTLDATVTEAPFTCNPANAKVAGTVTINATAGTAPYQYSFNGSATYTSNNVLTLNDNGTDQSYTYSVRDAAGCTVSGNGTLLRLNSPTDLTFVNAPITCNATTTTVELTAVNGVGTLQYETISPSPISRPKQTSNVFAGLTPGTYTFRVTDANGCYYTEALPIAPVTPIAIVGNLTNDVLCKGTSTGNGTFTISGIATPGNYTFTLTAGTLGSGTLTQSGNTLTLSNVAVGTYTVQVTDTATGCTNSASVIIGEPLNPLTFTALATNVNCNNDNSQITVSALGGTPNYTYAAVVGATAPSTSAYQSSNIITVDTNSAANLTWNVYVKDANGCITINPITIVSDAIPSVTAVIDNQCTASGSNFTITATGIGLGTLTYGINGPTGTFVSGNVFSVAPGPYTVWVKDQNGCTASAAPLTVYPQLTAIGAVKELDCSLTPDATITVTPSGGRSPYVYAVSTNGGTTFTAMGSNVYTTSTAGNFQIRVTDANNCTFIVTQQILPITNPTLGIASQVNVTCSGLSNGSVTLAGNGGSGGYTYSSNATTGFAINPTFTGLAAGTYTYYVRDSKGCVGSTSITITQPVTLDATTTVVPFSCNAANGKVAATVTINATAGTAPYQYSFNGSAYTSTNVLTLNDNGSDQNYTYSVRDAAGCIVSGSGTLERLNSPTDLSFANAAVTCNAPTATVTLTAVNGVGALQYETIAPSVAIHPKQTSNVFAGLSPGSYTFRVTDANGCYYTEVYTIAPVTPITVTATKLSDVNCFGGNTGSARFTVSGFAGAYSYSINGAAAVTGQTSATINWTNLTAGDYTIVVTDEVTGCDNTATISISEPAAALSATSAVVNATCNIATAAVEVNVTGGTPNYRYSFVQDGAAVGTYGPSNKANLNPSVNTEWDVYIIDAKGCTLKLDISIAKDPAPTVTASAVGQCLGVGTYTITATAGAGVGPFEYRLNNGAYQAGNTFTVTAAGNYTVTIRDANGCTAPSNIVTVYQQLTLSAVLDKDNTCSVPQTAQITLTATNGNNASYAYEVSSNGGATYSGITGNVFTTTVAGSYIFRVTDANGCQAVTTVPVVTTTPVNPEITSVTQTQTINCYGEDTAAISMTNNPALGLAPFVYNVLNVTTGQDYGTQTSGLAAGNYLITITDAKGCQDTQTITITEPSAIVVAHHAVPITCDGAGISKGSVIIDSVSGGVGPYNYFVTGVNGYDESELNVSGTTSVNFNVVDFGLYQINVVDSNGCSVLIQNVLVASPPEDLDIVIDTSVDCDTAVGGTAVVSIPASGSAITGAGPFYFSIYTGSEPVYPTNPTAWVPEDSPGSKSATFTNLTPGVTYTFIVYDADAAHGGTGTGCYYYETAEQPIPTNSTLTVSPTVAQNVTCAGAGVADGKVSFTITNIYTVDTTVMLEIFNSQSLATTGVTRSVTIPAGGTFDVDDLGPLPFGNYFVLITESAGSTNAGCSIATETFNITQSAIELSVTASVSKNANCNTNSGIITAVAKDGTAPYTYQFLLETETAPVATDAGWGTANTFYANAGNYTVYAKDAYGCIREVDITLDQDAEPVINMPPTICYVASPFTITLSGTVSVGPATYSVNGSAFQTDPNFTFNAAGLYNLVIKDGNGCTDNVDFEVKPQLQLTAEVTKELDCTGSSDAVITLTATGGFDSAYTYEYSTNGGTTFTPMTSNVLTTGVSGDYIFKVIDANAPVGCEETTTLTLDPLPAIVFDASATSITCNGDDNGTITVNVTSGFGPFEYQLFDGVSTTAFQASNVFTNLAPGIAYQITVRDGKSCELTGPAISITEPAELVATSAITTPLTCGASNAAQEATVVVTATPGTGTAPYEYSFNGGVDYSTDNTFTTYTGITFDVYVRDANGCIFILTDGVDVPALDAPTDMDISSTPIYCVQQGAGDVTSTVTITNVINGVGTPTFAILSPASAAVTGNTTGVFAGLAPDTYVFEVTDANGCKYQESYTIDPVTNITVSGIVVSDVTCNETPSPNNGAAEFTVSNFTGSYSYAINGTPVAGTHTSPTISLTDLAVGSYEIEVTDTTTGCIAAETVTVSQPATPLILALDTYQNANCNFGARVSVVATGGTPNYMYAFVQDGVTPVAGDYTASASEVLDPAVNTEWDVYVRDANGCIAILDVTIDTDDLPTINPSALPYCYTGGPVAITITGTYVGTPTYSIGNGYYASPDFTLNAPGNYTFYIKDGNGCIVSVPYTLRQELLLQATLTQDYTCAGDASINLLATQGTGVYPTYEVSFNSGGFAAVTTFPYTTNIPGTYTFRVTDDQGCQSVSIPVEVTPLTTPTATVTQNNVTCIGGNDGSIIVTAADGITPYRYSIDNGASFEDSNVFTGLTAGTYNLIVQDAKACESVALTVTITEPSALAATLDLTTPLSCGTGNATQPALVTVNVTAGTGTAPYQYSFNGGLNYSSTNTYSTYTAGTITAYVKDANGCIIAAPLDVVIPALDAPTDMDISSTPIYCVQQGAGDVTSTVTITNVINGVGTPTFAILSPASAAVTGNTTGVFAGLAPDTYVFEVTDANGCKYQESYTIDPVTNITVSGLVVSDITCNPGANGEIEFTVGNFAGTYSYSINGAAAAVTGQSNATISVSGLNTATTYTIVVTDEITGCQATTSLDVTISTPLDLAIAGNINANCNNGAQVSVTATGGNAPYQYSFVVAGSPAGSYGDSSAAILDPSIATAWDVYVRDVNGCVITTPLTLNIATDPLPGGITTNILSQCPTPDGEYTFTVNVTSGVGPFEFSLGNNGFQPSSSFTVNAPGTYDITVKDANNCTVTVNAAVTIMDVLDLQATVVALPGCSVADGIIQASTTGGTGNYRYRLNGGAEVNSAAATFTGVAAGTHVITVRDFVTGCTDSVTVEIVPATVITGFTIESTDVTCNGGSDSVIIANIGANAPGVNDNPVYTYTLTGTNSNGDAVNVGPQQLNIFTNLAAGDYTVTVTSGRGCIDQEDVRINQPNPIAVAAPVVSGFSCDAGSNATNFATITVSSVTGGSGVYAIYEFSKAGVVVQSGSSNVYTESNASGGTYTVRVFDDKGCEGAAVAPVLIAPFISLDDITVAVNTAISCVSNQDITVSVSSTGGVPAVLNYAVTGTNGTVYNLTNNSGVFTGLTIGNYLISVTNPVTGCSIQDTYYISNPNTFVIQATPVAAKVCYGEAAGSVDLTFIDNDLNPIDNAGAFNYVITGPVPSIGSSPTAGPFRISNLTAGIYTVTATLVNNPFCTVTNSFTIEQPSAPLSISETHTAITCISGNNDGSISVTASGGWSTDYEYSLSGPVNVAFSNQTEFTGLTAGTYTVTVRDAVGCEDSETIVLVNPDPIAFTVTPSTTMLSCFGDTSAVITVGAPTGGQGSNYMYTLNKVSVTPATFSGPQASPIFSNLGAGTYTVTVTDGFSCSESSADIIISEPTKVEAVLEISRDQTCVVETQLTLSATGGIAPYTYSTDVDFTSVLGSFTSSVSFDVPVGTYRYYVKDANGCLGFVSNDVQVVPLLPLELNLDVTDAVVKCTGDATGVIVANATGGLGNYLYTLQNASGNAIAGPQAEGRFENLIAGTYFVALVSGDCSSVVESVIISEPDEALNPQVNVTNVSCFGENNGRIEIITTGGTGVIKYAISPDLNQFDVKNVFEKLAAGNYTVIVQDANGCYVPLNIEILQPPLLFAELTADSIIQEECQGDGNGSFIVDIVGGTAPYTATIDNKNGQYAAVLGSQHTFDNLAGGLHRVYIKDALGCEYEFDVQMNEPVVLDPTVVINYDCINNANANMVTVLIDESIANPEDVDYSLDGGTFQLSNIFSDVAPGPHIITARHLNGCEVPTAEFTILAIDPLTLALSAGQQEMNVISVTAAGGAPAYEYSFNGEPFTSSNTYKIYESGDYEVIVRDQNGCEATLIVPMTYIDVCIPNYFTPNGDGLYDEWGPGCTNIYNDLEFAIYDRYGREIAKYRYGQKWDGRYKGEELPTGDYWYVLKLNDAKDSREFVGHFTLYR